MGNYENLQAFDLHNIESKIETSISKIVTKLQNFITKYEFKVDYSRQYEMDYKPYEKVAVKIYVFENKNPIYCKTTSFCIREYIFHDRIVSDLEKIILADLYKIEFKA